VFLPSYPTRPVKVHRDKPDYHVESRPVRSRLTTLSGRRVYPENARGPARMPWRCKQDRFIPHRGCRSLHLTQRGGYGMARRSPPRKVTYFEPVPPPLARNTIIESTFEVGRRFRCTMRVDCGQLEPGAVVPAGTWRMVPAYARAPRRRRARGLARRAQCGLSSRCPSRRRAPRGCRRISRAHAGNARAFLARGRSRHFALRICASSTGVFERRDDQSD
jgi:hypothetical protein